MAQLLQQTLDATREFHEVFGHPVKAKPTHELFGGRYNLIAEETKELSEGISEADAIKVLDGLADVAYVCAGSITAIETSLVEFDERVKAAFNYYASQNIGNNLFEDLVYISLLSTSMLQCLHKASSEALVQDQLIADEFLVTCGVLTMLIELSLRGAGVDSEALMNEIHESNMSKLWPSCGKERKALTDADPEKYSDVAFRPCLSRDGMVGYRLSDGKIIKCPTYKEVNLKPFVTEQLVEALESGKAR